MIRSLEVWSTEVCALAVLAAIWRILFPDLKKYGLFSLTRIVLLLCVARALIPAAGELLDTLETLPEPDTSMEQVADDAFLLAAERELSLRLAEKLRADGINVTDVRIDFTVTQEGAAPKAVSLTLPRGEADETLSAALSKEWGLPVRIAEKEEGTG